MFRLLAALFGSKDPEWKRQQALRTLEKDLKHLRPRFYNPSQRTLDPAMARFLHELYRALGPARVLLQGAETSGALRLITIESALSSEQVQLKERLTEQALAERARSADAATLVEEVRREISSFLEPFDRATTRSIDARFNNLEVLLDLVAYDYWFVLRKFDPSYPERDPGYKPSFRSVDAQSIIEELKDLLEVLPLVDPQEDWDKVLDVLKEYKGLEVISRDGIRRVIQLVREAQGSGAFLLIVRHVTGDPDYRPMVKSHKERIVGPYITKLRSQAESAVQKLAQSRATEKIEELAKAVFGATAVAQLANYSDQANAAFAGRMMSGYAHAAPLAYLHAFLADSLKHDLRELVDLLVIRGKWSSSQPAQQMSEAFHELLKIAEAIPRFDQALAEDGELGSRVRLVLVRAEKDRRALVELRPLLAKVNDQAKGMVSSALGHCVALAKVLKLVYDDSAKARTEELLNWRDLKGVTDRDLRSFIAAVYRRIYAFAQLMQHYR